MKDKFTFFNKLVLSKYSKGDFLNRSRAITSALNKAETLLRKQKIPYKTPSDYITSLVKAPVKPSRKDKRKEAKSKKKKQL